MNASRSRSFLPVLSTDVQFIVWRILISLVFGVVYAFGAYLAGYSPIIDFTFFWVASMVCLMLLCAISLIRRAHFNQ